MAHLCKGWCGLSETKGMVNLRPCIAYEYANRCSECSDIGHGIWFLKWLRICPCCGNILRRKSKHRTGRERMVKIEAERRSVKIARFGR